MPSKKNRTRSQIGQRNRANGKVWERTVVHRLKPMFGPDIRRGYQSRKGSDEPDVVVSDKIWVECKAKQGFSLQKTLEQCTRDIKKSGKDYKVVLVAVQRNDGQDSLNPRRKQRLWFIWIPEPKVSEEPVEDRYSFPTLWMWSPQAKNVSNIGGAGFWKEADKGMPGCEFDICLEVDGKKYTGDLYISRFEDDRVLKNIAYEHLQSQIGDDGNMKKAVDVLLELSGGDMVSARNLFDSSRSEEDVHTE